MKKHTGELRCNGCGYKGYYFQFDHLPHEKKRCRRCESTGVSVYEEKED